MNVLDTEVDADKRFFEAIKTGNNNDIIKFFRNMNYRPWTFLEDDEYTGII